MNLTANLMKQALGRLDRHLTQPVRLIVGGGGAMILAHDLPLATTDIDGVPTGISTDELDVLVKQVAAELEIPVDWLNPYYSTFTHVLPSDYGSRLQEVMAGQQLTALALSKDDLLIMKCFAGRQKDVSHAKALIKRGARVDFAETHIESLRKRSIPGAQKALDFLDDVVDQG